MKTSLASILLFLGCAALAQPFGRNAAFLAGQKRMAAATVTGNYTTTFPLNEQPLSEAGKWVDGATTGLLWSDCGVTNTSGGLHYAYGLMAGPTPPYNDSIALLTGTWGPTQAIDFTLYTSNTLSTGVGQYEELEWGLRCTLSNNWFSGYFMDCLIATDSGYFEAGAPNGSPYSDPSNIWNSWSGVNNYSAMILTNGSTIHAGITNATITVFFNGVQVANWTDTQGYGPTNGGGAPLIGFFHALANGDHGNSFDFGISSFHATDFSNGP